MTFIYREDALVTFAFYIAGFGVSALATLRNYVFAGDVHQGAQLLTWKEDKQSLVLVSRHLRTTSAFACDFLLHEGTLHLVLAEAGPAATGRYTLPACKCSPRRLASFPTGTG